MSLYEVGHKENGADLGETWQLETQSLFEVTGVRSGKCGDGSGERHLGRDNAFGCLTTYTCSADPSHSGITVIRKIPSLKFDQLPHFLNLPGCPTIQAFGWLEITNVNTLS